VDLSGRRPGSTSHPIPFTETLRRLESSPPRLSTPLVRRYNDVFQRVFERAGWDATAFRALRFEMKYPPWPSTVMLHYELPSHEE